MIVFLCKLWPYLAGGLIGWLAAGWFARRLKHSGPQTEKIVEKIVEKQIDNPQHLSLINKLETENKEISGLRTKLSGFESATPKTIDNPTHLKRIKELESQVYNFKNSSKTPPQAAVSTVTETVDNPLHLKRISELEAQVTNLKSAPSATSTTAQAAVSAKTKTIDNPVHLKRISELEAQVETLKQESKVESKTAKVSNSNDASSKPAEKSNAVVKEISTKTGTEATVDKAAAKAAGFRVKSKEGQDDFTVVEGIGPKINDLIHGAGIHRYAELGKTKVEAIQAILTEAGPRYSLAKPGTWPAQADFAAANKWEALKAWQDELDGGK